jgi:hypothetical protein
VRDLDKQEPIPPFITPPWRRGPHTYIDDDADKARNRHDTQCSTDKNLSIYTDGSGIEGEIGLATACHHKLEAYKKDRHELPASCHQCNALSQVVFVLSYCTSSYILC